jgi:hypothetical protein
VTALSLKIVEDDGDAVVEHDHQRALIQEGEYRAVYVRHEVVTLRRFGNASKVFIWFRIVDPGEAFGVELYRAYRVAKALGKRRFTIHRDSELLLMLARVLEMKQRPDRISLSVLKNMVLVIRVGTVTKTSTGSVRPDWLRYSTIRDILRSETGAT